MRSYTVDNRAKPWRPPLCAVCNKPCDSLEEYYDDFLERVVFTAVCHGQRERVTIERHELEALDRLNLSMGSAFAGSTRRLA